MSDEEDGVIGQVSWDMFRYAGENVIGANAITASISTDAETVLFWYQLKQVGLIDGVTNAGVRKDTVRAIFGETHPASELGGGYWIAHSDGCCGYGDNSGLESGVISLSTGRPESAGPFTLNGNILVMTNFPTGSREKIMNAERIMCSPASSNNPNITCDWKKASTYVLNAVDKENMLNPSEAKSIDAKLDDGNPATGIVQAYGNRVSCYKSFAGDFMYDEKVNDKHCGLYIKITD